LKSARKKLNLKSAQVLIIIFFFVFSLRVVSWFQYPYVLASGDLRPPFNSQALVKSSLTTWNEIDFGMPSMYPPRILDPFYFLITSFQTVGLGLFSAELATVFLIYFFSTTLTYIFVKQLTDDNIISVVAAIFFASNIYLINDREISAIGYVDLGLAMLPSLIAFARGIKTYSYKLMAISGVLSILTFGAFPNYRNTLICLIMQVLVLVYFYLKNQLRLDRSSAGSRISWRQTLNGGTVSRYAKRLVVFGLAFLLASIWVLAIIFSNFTILMSSLQGLWTPGFVRGVNLYDVTRLIAKWAFFDVDVGVGMPYIPYRNLYVNAPWFIFLCFVPAVLAFASLLLSKERKTTVFFGLVAAISLLLSSGFSFSVYGTQLYVAITDFFMLRPFREASNWMFFVVISFGVLIGCTVSALQHKFKSKAFRILSLALVVALFVFTAYPLSTGDVARNWIEPTIKGSYFPSSYTELNTMLSSRYWTFLAGGRYNYVVYNFTQGPLDCGNPYPLIFSKPVITGAGTEYIQSQNVELVNEVNNELNHLTPTDHNIAPEGTANASSIENNQYSPKNAIDGNTQTRWSSQRYVPQWLEVDWGGTRRISKVSIVFETAYSEDYTIQTWNGESWVTQLTVQNNTSADVSYSFSTPIDTTRLRLYFTKASEHYYSVSLWELEVYGRTIGIGGFLGVLGIKQVVVEKSIIVGNMSNPNDLSLAENPDLVLDKEWPEVALFNNTHALQRLYVGDNIISYETLNEMRGVAEGSEWDTLQHSVFVNSTCKLQTTSDELVLPTDFSWTELSPTSYEAGLKSNGAFILVLMESYDPNWKASVNGERISENNHFEVNGYANGWLVNATNETRVKINYETQNLFTESVAASAILPGLLVAFLFRNDLKEIIRSVLSRLKPRSANPKEQALRN
jgi:hypothetical protein